MNFTKNLGELLMQQSKPLYLFFSLLLALTGLVWLAVLTAPAQAGPTLPPRETPTKQADDDDDGRPSAPVGAYIVLQAGSLSTGAWGAVQWQDSSGNWHTVEGWQGPLPANNRWWVAAKDFRTGPFRWAILSGPGGEVSRSSASFSLPGQPNETLLVNLQ
jgi:hypothetical protein